jgi:hypothetical protein
MRAETVLYGLLEKCARTAQGHVVDPDDGVVRLLFENGLLEPLEEGYAARTTKLGWQMMQSVGHDLRVEWEGRRR